MTGKEDPNPIVGLPLQFRLGTSDAEYSISCFNVSILEKESSLHFSSSFQSLFANFENCCLLVQSQISPGLSAHIFHTNFALLPGTGDHLIEPLACLRRLERMPLLHPPRLLQKQLEYEETPKWIRESTEKTQLAEEPLNRPKISIPFSRRPRNTQAWKDRREEKKNRRCQPDA
jgi:hypothetical protein